MPIALLLQSPFARLPTLLAATKALMPWLGIIRDETTVLARARGAFMVGWFGRSLPRDGSLVRVAIANQAELDARLGELASGASPSASSSVVNPVAALAGQVSGILLSPVGLVANFWQLKRFGTASLTTLGLVLVAIASTAFWVLLPLWPAATLGAGAVVAVVLPLLSLAGGIVSLVVLRRYTDALLGAASSLGNLMTAATELVDQITGPRSKVRNPLVKELLLLVDALAPLGAQLLGATAFVIDQLGPRMVPAIRLLSSIKNAASTAGDTLGAVVEHLIATSLRFTVGDWSILPLLGRLLAVADTVKNVVEEKLDFALVIAQVTMQVGRVRLGEEVEAYVDKSVELVGRAFKEHPTVGMLRRLTASREKDANLPDAHRLSLPFFPPIEMPSLKLPDTAGVLKDLGMKQVPTLSSDAIKEEAARPRPPGLLPFLGALKTSLTLAGIADRPSIFAAEAPRLREKLVRNLTELRKLTDPIASLVSRLLSPSLWNRLAPQLAPFLDGFMTKVYNVKAAALAPRGALPVLTPEPIPVRPQIRTLRLQVPGASEAEARTLRDEVVRRIAARSYLLVPATSGR